MKKVFVAIIVSVSLSIAVMAAANSTITRKLGYEKNGNWTYSTDISYEGSCGTNCFMYYAPMHFCDIDGVYARVDTDTDYYLFNAWYSLDNGVNWSTYVDSEDCVFVYGVWPDPGYYLCYGQEQEGYNNWDGPGTSIQDAYMAFDYRYESGGPQYRREFYGDSCAQIE